MMTTQWPDSWCESAYRWTSAVYQSYTHSRAIDAGRDTWCPPGTLCPRCGSREGRMESDEWKMATTLAVLPGMQGPREGRLLPLGLSTRAIPTMTWCPLVCILGCGNPFAPDEGDSLIHLHGPGINARELDRFGLHGMIAGSEHEQREDLARAVRNRFVPVWRSTWQRVETLVENEMGRTLRPGEVMHLPSFRNRTKTTWIHPRVYDDVSHLFNVPRHRKWSDEHAVWSLEAVRPAVAWWQRGAEFETKALHGVWMKPEAVRLSAWNELCAHGATLRPAELTFHSRFRVVGE